MIKSAIIMLIVGLSSCHGMNILPKNRQKDSKPFVNLDRSNRRAFQLSGRNVAQLGQLMSAKNFSLLVSLRQEPNTDGTLLAIYSRPNNRMLDIFVDGTHKSIRVSFRVQTGMLDELSGEKDLTDGQWHKLILEVQGHSLRVIVDCHQILSGTFSELDFSEMTASYARPIVWVGQLNPHISMFTGSLKEFSANSGALSKSHCGTPTTTAASNQEDRLSSELGMDYLNHRVRYLENEFKRWREVVDKHERQLQSVHLYQRGCKLEKENVFLSDGEKLINTTSCTQCDCHRGVAHCKPKGCPKLNCAYPVLNVSMDPCCPHCGRKCFYMGKYYEHGHIFWPKKCVKCSCTNGDPKCSYEKAECPPLPCPRYQQKTPGNQCCPVCENRDFCADNPCHSNATCTNRPHDGKCECKEGFFGSGYRCFDIDECLWTTEMAEQLGGCGKGTRCINTPGSYRCECLPGYMKFGNSNSCIDVVLV